MDQIIKELTGEIQNTFSFMRDAVDKAHAISTELEYLINNQKT
jgi:hypothetical protein